MEILPLGIWRQHIGRKGACQCQTQSWPYGRVTDAFHKLGGTSADKQLHSTEMERNRET